MTHETTPEQFEIFKVEFTKWQKFFGLLGWEVSFDHRDIEHRGTITFDIASRCATVTLGKKWDNYDIEIDKVDICKTAFHEACELLLGRLRVLALARFLHQEEIDEEVHVIVRTLENVFWDN